MAQVCRGPITVSPYNMQGSQLRDLKLWAALTIQIGSDLIAPAIQKENVYHSLMILTDPKHQRIDSNLWKLLSRARKELQRARQATRATQSKQASGSSSATQAPSRSHTHPNIPNHIALPQTRTPTQPPRNYILALVTPESDLIPPPKMIKHAPTTSPSTVDGRPEQGNNTDNDAIYGQQTRWASTESLESQEREQNSTADHINHSPGALRMPASVLGTMLPDKHNATPAPGSMVQVCDLVRSPQFNGLRGEIESHTDDDRWIVKLQNGKTIALKRFNFQTLSPPPADYDMPTPTLPPVPSPTYEPASANTPAPTPSPTNTSDNRPKPSAYTPNHTPTSPTSQTKMCWWEEEYNAYPLQKDTPVAATQNTTHDKDDNRPGPSARTSNDNHTPHTTPHTQNPGGLN